MTTKTGLGKWEGLRYSLNASINTTRLQMKSLIVFQEWCTKTVIKHYVTLKLTRQLLCNIL